MIWFMPPFDLTRFEWPLIHFNFSLQPEEFIENNDNIILPIEKDQVAEIVLEEMECPICLIEMAPPKKIYACTNAHLFCQNCKVPALKTCPKCREDFVTMPPIRSILAERWACKIFQLWGYKSHKMIDDLWLCSGVTHEILAIN